MKNYTNVHNSNIKFHINMSITSIEVDIRTNMDIHTTVISRVTLLPLVPPNRHISVCFLEYVD